MCIGLNNKRPKVQNPASMIVWGCVSGMSLVRWIYVTALLTLKLHMMPFRQCLYQYLLFLSGKYKVQPLDWNTCGPDPSLIEHE